MRDVVIWNQMNQSHLCKWSKLHDNSSLLNQLKAKQLGEWNTSVF